MNNDAKKERIDILKSEHDTITKKLNASKDLNSRNVRDLETKLYSETHTKNLLTEEKKKLNAVLNVLRQQNAQSDRTIKQMKHFTGKRDKVHKEMQDEKTKNEEELARLNKDLVDLSWKKDQEDRRLKDRDLLKR
jgi:hypothetical protein